MGGYCNESLSQFTVVSGTGVATSLSVSIGHNAYILKVGPMANQLWKLFNARNLQEIDKLCWDLVNGLQHRICRIVEAER